MNNARIYKIKGRGKNSVATMVTDLDVVDLDDLDGELKYIIARLQTISEELYKEYESVIINIYNEDHCYTSIWAYGYRPENEKEKKIRMDKDKKERDKRKEEKEQRKEKEYQKYLELKEKYDQS